MPVPLAVLGPLAATLGATSTGVAGAGAAGAAATGGAGILSALLPFLGPGAGILGNLLGGQEAGGLGSEDIRAPRPNPLQDELLAALTGQSLLGLGTAPSDLTARQGTSPVEQVIEEINRSPDLNDKQKRRAIQAIRNGQTRLSNLGGDVDQFVNTFGGDFNALTGDNSQRREAQRALPGALGAAGFGSVEDLLRSEAQFQQNLEAGAPAREQAAQTIEQNRLQALTNLSDIAANAGLRVDELTELFLPQIQNQFDEARERINQDANVGRINPAGRLAALDEAQARGEDRVAAIDRALQTLSGQASITSGALTGRENFALNTSAQRQQGILNLLNVGAAQQNAQQQLAQQQSENRGSSIAAAGGNVANAITLQQILGQIEEGGPGGGSGNASANLLRLFGSQSGLAP